MYCGRRGKKGEGRVVKRLTEGVKRGERSEGEGGSSRYAKYQYEKWMWGAIDGDCYALPSVEMLTTLVRLKQQLWQRYGMFYDAETIGEVYPENELMEWVWEAFGGKTEPTMKWRDGEMAYE